MMDLQRTIKRIIYFNGVGLHTGEKVWIRVHPSDACTGIVLKRVDIASFPISATIENVVDSRYATVLGVDGVTVFTVEHLLAALYGMGIDNAFIEVHGPEIPAMDGSAQDFVEGILDAGTSDLIAQKQIIAPVYPIEYSDDGRKIILSPENLLEIDYTINFNNPGIGRQQKLFALTPESFRKEIASARTFGFLSEVNMLKQMGLAKGGSTSSAIVVGEFGVLNNDGLRFEDEFVRHKILDLIGDLSLLGSHLWGRIVVEKGGHMLNHTFVKEVLSRMPQTSQYFSDKSQKAYVNQ
ncbi:MAG TPA: UDP-3-O-acyl-N-acetylglucosamine deacetylase [bacterium]